MSRTALALAAALLLGGAAAHGQESSWGELGDLLSYLAKTYPLPKTVINYDGGGLIYEYEARWRTVAAQGSPVEILGLCESACTLITAHVPKDRICFGPRAALNFHTARVSSTDNTPDMRATQWMIDRYPSEIQAWIKTRGGIWQLPWTPLEYWSLPANQLWQMGYKRCSN